MEIEHLQMIIDAMKEATEGAFWLAVLWIGKSYGSGIAWLLVAVIAALTTRVVTKTLSDGATARTKNKDGNEKEKNACVQAFFAMVRADPDYDPKGYQSDFVHDSDLRRIHKIFAEGCATIEKRKKDSS